MLCNYTYSHGIPARDAKCSMLKYLTRADASRRTDSHWQEVQRKQRLVAELRAKEGQEKSEVIADFTIYHSSKTLYSVFYPTSPGVLSREIDLSHCFLSFTVASSNQWFSICCCLQVNRLATQLADANRNVADKQRALPSRYCRSWQDRSAELEEAKEKASNLSSSKRSMECQLRATQGQLQEAEKAPAAVMQPLPSNSDSALVWLFHLHMPLMLRHLSHISFLGAQVFLPSPEQRAVHAININAVPCPTDMCAYYNKQQQPSTYLTSPRQHSGTQGHVAFRSSNAVPELKDVGPKHVDSFYSK